MPTLDYLTGFNHQVGTWPTAENALGYVAGSATMTSDSSTVRRTGGSSFKVVCSTNTGEFTKQLNAGSAIAGVAGVCYVNFSVLPSANTRIFTISAGTAWGVGYSLAANQFALRTSTGPGTAFGPVVSTGTWYRIEFGLDTSGTAYTGEARAAVEDGAATALAFSGGGAQTANPTGVNIRAGIGVSVVSGTVFVTDLAVSVAFADYPLGPTAVYGYSPNAVGTHNLDAATSTFFFKDTAAPPGGTTTALTTSETTSYQMLDEVPIDGGTDAVKVVTNFVLNTPTFRSAGAWSFSANNVASPFTCTPGAPAGKATGDLLLLVCQCRSITATVGTPAGWNVVTGNPFTSGTASGGRIYLFTRIADGSASDTPSPIWTGQTTGTSGDACGAGILAYTNATETVDATAVTQDLSAQGSTSTISGITTVTDKSLVVNAAMKLNESSGQTATVTTYTEDSDNSTTSGTGHIIEVSHLVKTPAGASGSGTITWSATTSARALIVTIALKATAASTTEPTNTWYAEYAFGVAGTQVAPTTDPYAVRAICDQRLDTAVSSTWAAKVFDSVQGSNEETISSASISATAAAFVGSTFTQRPNSGGQWTIAALNGTRLRFGYTAAADGHPRVESAMLEAAVTSPQPAILPDVGVPLQVT